MATPAPADAAPQFEGVSFAVSSKIAKKQSIRVRKESMRLKKEATKEYPSPAREAFACLGTEGIDAAEVDSTASTSGVVSVPLPAVLTVLERKIAKSSLSTDLLVYIPFMIAFTVFLTNGRDVTEVFYSVQAIKEELLSQPATPYDAYKTFADVKSISEYNAWLRTVFVPSLYHPCVGNESSLASSARPYKGNHLLLGAVRLRTILASNNSCTLDSALFGGDRGAGVCRGSHHDGESVELRFGRYNPLYPVSLEKTKESYLYQHTPCSEAAGGQYIVGDVTWYHCGGYIVDVPFSKACDAVLSLVDLLEAAPFVDEERARFASVEFFLHHPALHTFTSVKIYIEISPSGAVIPAAQLRSFLVWTESDSKGNTIFDFFFFAFVLYYLYKYVRDCILHKRSKGSLISFFLDVWNLLETANLLIFLVVFALRWTWWDVSKQKLTAFPYSPKYPEHLDTLLTLWNATVYVNSVNATLVFLRLLKFLRLNPRLGVLSMAVSEKKSQLIGVLVLFTWTLFAFSLAGNSLYGSTMWEFRSLSASFVTLLRMLLGDFSRGRTSAPGANLYEGMRQENRILSGGFFWGYMILVYFVLLNMIIAVLAEGFSAVSAKRPNVPLSLEIARAFESLKRFCQPDRLLQVYHLFRKGMSEADCLRKVALNVEEHHRLVQGENQDVVDEDTSLTKETFKMYMSTAEYAALGPALVDDLWHEIVVDYTDRQRTDEGVRDEELLEAVNAGTGAVINPAKSSIAELNSQSRGFDLRLSLLLDKLQKHVDDPSLVDREKDISKLADMQAKRLVEAGDTT